uniref:Uncharacterized protein n=1 Tax=Pyramimonas obovata TaxID=1411642 RepID=A0A7S0RB12_9CHLO
MSVEGEGEPARRGLAVPQLGWPFCLARMNEQSPNQAYINANAATEPSPLFKIRGTLRQAVKDALTTKPTHGDELDDQLASTQSEDYQATAYAKEAARMVQEAAEREQAYNQHRAYERANMCEEHVNHLIEQVLTEPDRSF